MEKKLIRNLFALTCLLFGMTGCLKEDVIDQKEQPAEINFVFDLGDMDSKTETTPTVPEVPIYGEGKCKTLEQLQALAQGGHLTANITVAKTQNSSDPTKVTIPLRINHLGGTRFQTLTYALDVTTYYVHAVTITSDKPEDSAINPLFSGVGHNSKFAAYIPEGQHMTEAHFLVEKFKKTPVDLWVLCATRSTPLDFGFIKWNINYVQAHCFPFMVNICTPGDVSGAGTLLIEYKNKDTQEYAALQPAINFDSNGKYDEICFKDDYAYANADELYKFTLTINGKTQTKYITLETLLQYKQSSAWDATHKLMHLDFCTCETWIFDCETTNVDIPDSKCIERLRFVEGNSSTGGSDNYLEFWKYIMNGNSFIGDGDATPYEIFEDYKYENWGDIALYDTDASNGVFSLMNGIICRSINGVPFNTDKKEMKILLDVKAPTTYEANPGNPMENLFKVLIFNMDGSFVGSFPYMGEVNTPNANDNTYLFKDLKSHGLVNKNGVPIDLTLGVCYRVGIQTYYDKPWTIDIKRFWVQTQGN